MSRPGPTALRPRRPGQHRRPARREAGAVCARPRAFDHAGVDVGGLHAALADGLEAAGNELGHVVVVEQGELHRRLGQQEVAGQDAHLVAHVERYLQVEGGEGRVGGGVG